MMKRVIGYIRVSTDKQAESGLSMEAQAEKVRSYCALYDLDLITIIEDSGASAKNLNRTGINTLKAMVAAGEVDGVVVAKLDRLTRNMKDLHTLLEDVFSVVELHSVAEKVDTSSAAGRLVLNVLMSVAAWEREAIGERTSAALQAKKARGEALGTAPYGKKWEDGALVNNPEEMEVLALIRELRCTGLTFRALAAELEARGVINRKGRAVWSLSALKAICDGEVAA
jgi:site-specific DNA recombinase